MSPIDRYADWLGLNHPTVYKLFRPVWKTFNSVLDKNNYWEKRKNYSYYAEVMSLARSYSSDGDSVIDVGSNETELLSQMDWFKRRIALDIRYIMPVKEVETVVCDFMDFKPDIEFDIVLCLQVLEHLTFPERFAKKLFSTGNTIILSVPYKWPADYCNTHLHDPVDEKKLMSWTKMKPLETRIVKDVRERLIAVYKS